MDYCNRKDRIVHKKEELDLDIHWTFQDFLFGTQKINFYSYK